MTQTEFFADSMLGKLARWLRLMGFSVEYAKPERTDDDILTTCIEKGLFLLTRDRELAQRYPNSMYMPSDKYPEQLRIFLATFKPDKSLYFSRCPLCNGKTVKTLIRDFEGEVPEGVRERFEHIYVCSVCGKIYWEGSHFEAILKTIKGLTGEETE